MIIYLLGKVSINLQKQLKPSLTRTKILILQMRSPVTPPAVQGLPARSGLVLNASREVSIVQRIVPAWILYKGRTMIFWRNIIINYTILTNHVLDLLDSLTY